MTDVIFTEVITKIGEFAFNGTSLTNITLPNTLSIIGNSAFNCSNLTKVYFLGNNMPTIGTNNFPNANDTAYYFVGAQNTNVLTMFKTAQAFIDSPTNVQSYLYISTNGTSSTGISVSWEHSIASIKKYVVTAYVNSVLVYTSPDVLYTLSSTVVPSTSLTEGETYTFKVQAFYDAVTSDYSIVSISTTFEKKMKYSSLNAKEASVSGFETGVINCAIASKVQIGTVFYIVTNISNYAFSNNLTIKSVLMPPTITNIGSASFQGCTNLLTINIPNTVTNVGNSAFQSCKSLLSSMTFPDSVITMGSSVCYECSSLVSITLPNSLTSIQGTTFANCTSLKSIRLPKTLQSIGVQAFYNCTSLTSITIPNTTTIINDSAFNLIPKLLNVYFLGNIPTINAGNFVSLKDVGYYFGTVTSNYPNINSYFTTAKQLTYPINVEALLNIPTTGSFPNGIFISWDYEDVATSYKVLVLDSSNATVNTITQIVEKKTIITGLTSGQTYTFKVQAINNSTLSDISTSNSVFYTTNIKYSVVNLEAGVSGYQNNPTNVYFESKVIINGTSYWVTSISESAFAGSGLTNVTINPTINNIYKCAFNNCSSLTTVNFSGVIV